MSLQRLASVVAGLPHVEATRHNYSEFGLTADKDEWFSCHRRPAANFRSS